ncbi:VanZ family protein [Alkalicoccus urumqiensis]|nr:VanZ family protein [Alkalicoccus urumqiensis]
MKRAPTYILTFLFALYLAGVLYVVFFAWNYGSSLGAGGPGGRNVNLEVWKSIHTIAVYSPGIRDPLVILGGNILMFTPFGFLLYFLLNQTGLRSFIIVSAGACCFSVFIEVNQYVFTYRVANIDDVLLNTAGALIGWLAAACLNRVMKGR